MRYLRVLIFFLLAASISGVHASVILEEGFESGQIPAGWTVRKTDQGRVRVMQEFGPAAGGHHLVLDDAVNDTRYSLNEVVVPLDLTGKRNVVLDFKAKRLGDEIHWGWGLIGGGNGPSDGVSLSPDGGLSWFPVHVFTAPDGEWETVSLRLDDYYDLGYYMNYGPDFLIRFSQYDNSSAPVDGIALDDIVVTADEDRRVMLEMVSGVEGSGPHKGYVLLTLPSAEPLEVTFSQSSGDSLILPAAVTVPAGETMVEFTYSIADDSLSNMDRDVRVTPMAGASYDPVDSYVWVKDNDPPPVVLLTLPAELREGEYPNGNARLNLAAPVAADVTFSISMAPYDQIYGSNSVTIPAGETEALFSLYANNDSAEDGDVPVTVTLTHPNFQPVSGQVLVVDNEARSFSVILPGAVAEGAAVTATVELGSASATEMMFHLAGSPGISLPGWVVVPAGSRSASFQVRAVDDILKNGTRTLYVSATTSGMGTRETSIKVLDDEPAPRMTLTIPAEVAEGESMDITFTLDSPLDVDLNVTISQEPAGEFYELNQFSIPAGKTSHAVSAVSRDDGTLEDDKMVQFTATTGSGFTSAGVTVKDNDVRQFSVDHYPGDLTEGSSSTGRIYLSGPMEKPLLIHLVSSEPSLVDVPPTVLVPAWQSFAEFPIRISENNSHDGWRQPVITVSADGFPSVELGLDIADNDPVAYDISELPQLVDPSAVSLNLSAYDVNGGPAFGHPMGLRLELVLPEGGTLPLRPGTIQMGNSATWYGTVEIPLLSGDGYRIRVSDVAGVTVESGTFSLIRRSPLQAGDLVWDASRGLIYASILSGTGQYGNRVVAINPRTLEVVNSTYISNPGKMAMTDGAEYLYVGTSSGYVLRIELSSFTTGLPFSLGTDGYYYSFNAENLCAVPGRPEMVLVGARAVTGNQYTGAFQNGVALGSRMAGYRIERSADPTVFYTHGTENWVRRVKLGTGGLTQLDITNDLLLSPHTTTHLRSDGDRFYTNSGLVVDGTTMTRGTGRAPQSTTLAPDRAKGRVYFFSGGSRIDAVDAESLDVISSRTVPYTGYSGANSLIRWGEKGLAYRSSDGICFLEIEELVPTGPEADLATSVEVSSPVARAGGSLTYTVTMFNAGVNPALGARMELTLPYSLEDSVLSVTGGELDPADFPKVVIRAGDMAPGASCVATVTLLPDVTKEVLFRAWACTRSPEPDVADNAVEKVTGAAIPAAGDTAYPTTLYASNLVNDPTRKRIWCTLTPGDGSTVVEPSLIWLDPLTGEVSQRVLTGMKPLPGSIALSANGRYLYHGVEGNPVVCRYDLSVWPPVQTRIPMVATSYTSNYARDIEVLDGDGTGFICTGTTDGMAVVYDGATPRSVRTQTLKTGRIERGAAPGTFISHNYFSGSYEVTVLTVSAAGVSVTKAGSSANSASRDIVSSGGYHLDGAGYLWDSATLTRRLLVQATGAPCLDSAYDRAYIAAQGGVIHAYSIQSGTQVGQLAYSDVAGSPNRYCIRWGVDGLALTAGNGMLSVARWSLAVPPEADLDGDGIADSWGARYFAGASPDPEGDADGDGIPNGFEYAFGTSPTAAGGNPLQCMADAGMMKFGFSRRKGFPRTKYVYETSPDLKVWTEAAGTETTAAAPPADGVEMETVTAEFPAGENGRGFVRLKWKR